MAAVRCCPCARRAWAFFLFQAVYPCAWSHSQRNLRRRQQAGWPSFPLTCSSSWGPLQESYPRGRHGPPLRRCAVQRPQRYTPYCAGVYPCRRVFHRPRPCYGHCSRRPRWSYPRYSQPQAPRAEPLRLLEQGLLPSVASLVRSQACAAGYPFPRWSVRRGRRRRSAGPSPGAGPRAKGPRAVSAQCDPYNGECASGAASGSARHCIPCSLG